MLEHHRVLVRAVVAGHQRHAGFFHQLLGLGLQAHRLDGGRWRADEDQPGAGAGFCEFFVFTHKTIAGVNRLGPRGFGRVDDAFPAQVTVLGRAAADMHGLVAGAHMLGVRIRIGIHGDGADGHAARGGRHPAGDFAAVGNQDLMEHRVVLAAAGALRKKRPAS